MPLLQAQAMRTRMQPASEQTCTSHPRCRCTTSRWRWSARVREGYIGLGFCTADVNMDRLPGWEPQSYGYHGDDGNAFRSDGKGRKYGPQFETGQSPPTFHAHHARP